METAAVAALRHPGSADRPLRFRSLLQERFHLDGERPTRRHADLS
jgi:hypothetical protein